MAQDRFHSPHAKELVKCLDSAYGHRQNRHTMVYEWCEAAFASLYQNVRIHSGMQPCQKLEDRYNRITSSLKAPEYFPQAMAHLVNALEEKQDDFLGQLMGDLQMLDSANRGQVFTPYALCELTAQMIFQGVSPQDYNEFRKMRIDEPACGGGALVIAATQVLKKQGLRQGTFMFEATDVDFKCVAMAYIQFTLLDIPALVHWGNTLSLEHWGTFPTFALIRHPDWGNANVCKIKTRPNK